jgi:hypothetical protein
MLPDKRARTVEEAAYNHLLVFTQPVDAWPDELKQRLPPFADLYVDPPKTGRRPDPVTVMTAQLRNVPGPVKLLLTGQRGSGKSWALQHMGDLLADTFTVIRVSATDHSGTTLADAEASDVMVLLCEALSQRITTWESLAEADLALRHWVLQFQGHRGLPTVPTNTDGFDVEINALFAKFASRMRSDQETRRLVREVGADDLIVVANALLDVLNARRPVLVLFDDLDKVDAEMAGRLFGPQFSLLGSVRAKMVMTFPFSLNFGNTLTQRREVLLNVQVHKDRNSEAILPEAVERFTRLLDRLIDLGSLIEGSAVERAVSRSGGITREFGRIVARAFEIAALCGDPRVLADHVDDAIRDLRIELERATSDDARRSSLKSVRRTHLLATAVDRSLLNENMIVEYVNGHPWHDVHPLLAEVVDSWPVT